MFGYSFNTDYKDRKNTLILIIFVPALTNLATNGYLLHNLYYVK